MNVERLIGRVQMLGIAIQAHTAVQELHVARTREESEQRKVVQVELDHLFAEATRVRDECETLIPPMLHDVEIEDFLTRARMSLDQIEERANDLIESERSQNDLRALRHS